MASVIVVAALAWLLLQPAEPATAPGAAQAATGPSVAIEQPWARAATRPEAGTGGTSAVYMTLRNTGSIGDQLLGASSDVADLTEIHRTTVEDGVMKMRPAGPLDVPAGGTLTLEPGGLHVMLTNLRRDLTASEQVTVTLHLERAGDLVVDAEVRAPASQPMSQPMHGR